MNRLFAIARTNAKEALRYCTEYISPPICIGCGRDAVGLCRSCNLELAPAQELVCPSCLQPSEHGLRCSNCTELCVPLAQLICACSYESRVFHRVLAGYKERGRRDLSRLLGTRLCGALQANLPKNVRPIVVPIPCSTKRKRIRGFDQAELLARYVSHKLKLDYQPLLTRGRTRSASQKELGILARRKSLKGVYGISKKQDLVDAKRRGVLLIDDVATSLATLETCAMTLQAAGIASIRAATLAHAAIG